MRKPRDYDAELKALEDKALELKNRKVRQLGELVIASGADSFSIDELAGALLVLPRRKTPPDGKHGPGAGRHSFAVNRADLQQRLSATLAALKRNRAARNRHRAALARLDMRAWQVERRKRTRHLIELGGLVVKAGIVHRTGDNRATIYGAMLWMADKLQSEYARGVWKKLGKKAFEAEQADTRNRSEVQP